MLHSHRPSIERAPLTFVADFAEVSMKKRPYSSAYACASWRQQSDGISEKQEVSHRRAHRCVHLALVSKVRLVARERHDQGRVALALQLAHLRCTVKGGDRVSKQGRTQLFARANESLFVMSYTMMAAAAPASRTAQSEARWLLSRAHASVVHWCEAVVALLACGIPAITRWSAGGCCVAAQRSPGRRARSRTSQLRRSPTPSE